MYKEAQFTEGFFKELVESFGPKAFAQRPFETIFKVLGPMVIWRMNWLLGLLAFGLEAFGIGPSIIGKFIDNAIGAGKGGINLSEGNLKAASMETSGNLIDMVKEKLEGATAADAILENVLAIKGCIEPEDVISATYVAKSGFIKTARPGRVGLLRRFLRLVTGGRRLGLANAIYGIIRTLALGILGVSAATGLASWIKGAPVEKDKPTVEEQKESPMLGGLAKNQPPMGTYYANDARDVETTILAWLDKIEGFEKVFKAMRPTDKSITQSIGFQKLLRKIERMNNAPINQIDKWKAFVGPSPEKMVKIILPGAVYEPAKDLIKPKKELTKLLGEVL